MLLPMCNSSDLWLSSRLIRHKMAAKWLCILNSNGAKLSLLIIVVCTDHMDVHDNGMDYSSVSVVLVGDDRSINMSMPQVGTNVVQNDGSVLINLYSSSLYCILPMPFTCFVQIFSRQGLFSQGNESIIWHSWESDHVSFPYSTISGMSVL